MWHFRIGLDKSNGLQTKYGLQSFCKENLNIYLALYIKYLPVCYRYLKCYEGENRNQESRVVEAVQGSQERPQWEGGNTKAAKLNLCNAL